MVKESYLYLQFLKSVQLNKSWVKLIPHLWIKLSPENKVASSIVGKNHISIVPRKGHGQAQSCCNTQCNRHVSMRVATRAFIKLKVLSRMFGTTLLPGSNFSRAKFTPRTMQIKRCQMCFKRSIELHTFG